MYLRHLWFINKNNKKKKMNVDDKKVIFCNFNFWIFWKKKKRKITHDFWEKKKNHNFFYFPIR